MATEQYTGPIEVTDETFEQHFRDLDPEFLVLLEIWATAVGPCRAFGPIVEQILGEKPHRLRHLRAEMWDSLGTTSRYDVRSVPTLLVLDESGSVVESMIGNYGDKAKALLSKYEL